jgi:hypothetical protein
MMPINTTTKQMNEEKNTEKNTEKEKTEKEKTKLLTSLHRKTKEMEEPARISLFRDEHNEKIFNIGSGAVLLSVVSYVGASLADTAGISIVTKVLASVSLLSLFVGISISLIAIFRELRT